MSARSPVPSLDIRREGRGPGQFTADNAIPGLDINPPEDEVQKQDKPSTQGEGLGGWISRLTQRTKGEGKKHGGGGYGRLREQDDE